MKKLFFLLCLVCNISVSQNLDSLDSKTEFRGFVFGEIYNPDQIDELTESPMMSTFAPKSKQKYYFKKNDNLNFGSLKANTVYYIFVNNIFVGYNIIFKKNSDLTNVTSIISGLYGPYLRKENLNAYTSYDSVPITTWEGSINTCNIMALNTGFGVQTWVGFLNKPANLKALGITAKDSGF